MPRRPRSVLPNGAFHAFNRGVAKSTIFLDDVHFATFMEMFESACLRFDWHCEHYCLMPNHYHLIVGALRPRLSRGMHWLNGRYAQWFNALHDRVGHVFQNRFGAYVIDTDRHFEKACQYVEANPVRAGLCAKPEEWPWSSAYARACTGDSAGAHEQSGETSPSRPFSAR